MTIREWDKVTVCRYCKRSNLDGLRHGEGFNTGTPDNPDIEIVCLWPCGHHEIPDEPRCLTCEPFTNDEVPF